MSEWQLALVLASNTQMHRTGFALEFAHRLELATDALDENYSIEGWNKIIQNTPSVKENLTHE